VYALLFGFAFFLFCSQPPIAQPELAPLCRVFRIHKYASCSNECFILALIYIDRLIQRNNFLLTELNVHRVVICAVLLAAKFFDDAYYNNAYYAKVGGVLVSEINGLEVDFLFRINFSLHVTPEEFDKYRVELLQQAHTPEPQPMYPAPVQVSPEVHSAPATMEAEPIGIAPCAAPPYQIMAPAPAAPMMVVPAEDQLQPMVTSSFPNTYYMPHVNMVRANSMPVKPISPSFPTNTTTRGPVLVQPRMYSQDTIQMMEQQYGVVLHHHHGTGNNATCVPPASPNEGMGRRVAGMSGVGM